MQSSEVKYGMKAKETKKKRFCGRCTANAQQQQIGSRSNEAIKQSEFTVYFPLCRSTNELFCA